LLTCRVVRRPVGEEQSIDPAALSDRCLSHMANATLSDLRNHFSKVKKLIETEGEVVVTDNGEPKYKLTLYTAASRRKPSVAKDYIARLRRHQARPISSAASKSLNDENRGDR
jgi:antitoxin (DNA-binding transcriptional repressor) of toxin-antitoxin stability system